LKYDILNGNKYAVASKIAFPRTVFIKGEKVTINSEREFIEQFDDIFYPEYIQAISKCFPINMSSSYRGIMFGDKGQIWINVVLWSPPRLMVTAINNRPEDMPHFLQD
jgi:hypothetical protein